MECGAGVDTPSEMMLDSEWDGSFSSLLCERLSSSREVQVHISNETPEMTLCERFSFFKDGSWKMTLGTKANWFLDRLTSSRFEQFKTNTSSIDWKLTDDCFFRKSLSTFSSLVVSMPLFTAHFSIPEILKKKR